MFKSTSSDINKKGAAPIQTIEVTNAEMNQLKIDYLAAGDKTPYIVSNVQDPNNKSYYIWSGTIWYTSNMSDVFNVWRGAYANNSAETTATSYAIVSELIFGGTSMLGTPAEILALLEMDGATNIDIKIFDRTNALKIAEKLANVVGTPTIVNLGILANLSIGQAIWEIQLRRTGGGGSSTSTIHSFQIK